MNHITFEDAWIFLAMKYAENESLDYYAKVIGYCDYINQTIPAYDELIATYNKLLYLGILKKEGERAYFSEFGSLVYVSAVNNSEPDTSPRRLAELIQAELKPYKLKSACRQTPLTNLEYIAAYSRYTLQRP